MSSLAVSFFREGLKIPEIEKLQYSHYLYTAEPHPEKVASDAESLLKIVQENSLQDRVQQDLRYHHLYTVDQFFLVAAPPNAPRTDALQLWSGLRTRCQMITIGSGLAAASLTLLALRKPSFYIVALFVGIIASCCFTGWGYHRYQIADHQVAVWDNPGEDFALRRKAALEMPLHEISKKKCHFRNPQGTLLGLEMLHLFKSHFKTFADPLLAQKCNQPSEKEQWVSDFFSSNPLMFDFFTDNLHLSAENGWAEIKYVQNRINDVQAFLQWKANIPDEQEFPKKIKETIEARIKAVPNAPPDYQQKLLQSFNTEFLPQIPPLIQQHKAKADSLDVYSYTREILEKMNEALFNQKIFRVDPKVFQDLPNFQEQLETIFKNYAQNVIDGSADPAYQKFVIEAFKP